MSYLKNTTIDNEAGTAAGNVKDIKAQDIQTQMLIQLRIMNLYLSKLSDEVFTEEDVENEA